MIIGLSVDIAIQESFSNYYNLFYNSNTISQFLRLGPGLIDIESRYIQLQNRMNLYLHSNLSMSRRAGSILETLLSDYEEVFNSLD